MDPHTLLVFPLSPCGTLGCNRGQPNAVKKIYYNMASERGNTEAVANIDIKAGFEYVVFTQESDET